MGEKLLGIKINSQLSFDIHPNILRKNISQKSQRSLVSYWSHEQTLVERFF